MKGAGGDIKLPAGSPDAVKASGETNDADEIIARPVVECATCIYFRLRDMKLIPQGVEIDADGNCYVEPPATATIQGIHALTQKPVMRIVAMRNVVKNRDLCSHWRDRETFPGDAGIAQGEASEAIADTLGEVVRYLREMVLVGGKDR